jgi:two-component system chemotaxis response regulator CheB
MLMMGAIIVIGGSAGALAPLIKIISAVKPGSQAAFFVVIHIGANRSKLPTLLGYATSLPAAFAQDGGLIEAGHIYAAPPDHHLLLSPSRTVLTHDEKVHFTRPAVDPLFESAARSFGRRVVGVVLSGGDGDGTAGLRAIKEHGGLALIQDPEGAAEPSMPHSALMSAYPDGCLPIELLAKRISELAC